MFFHIHTRWQCGLRSLFSRISLSSLRTPYCLHNASYSTFGETEPFKKQCGHKHKEIERERKELKMLSKLRLSHLFGSTKNSDGGCLYSLPVFVNGIFLKGKPLEFDLNLVELNFSFWNRSFLEF